MRRHNKPLRCCGGAEGEPRKHRPDCKTLTAPKKRTAAQQALLDRLPADGSPKRFNGRARSMVEALKAEGVITYEFTLRPATIGKWTELFIVRRVLTSKEQ